MITQKQMANALRFLSVDMIEKAKSGHPGMPLGMADVATVLWSKFLRFDPSCPHWANRDRFVLSNGHGSALLYSLLYVTGFQEVSLDEIKNFRQWGSKTAGHPEMTLLEGVDFTTGPLGQGFAGAVGLALAERILNARYGDDIINHKTYVFAGDGCLMEGISEEALELAGLWQLKNLIVLWDDNHITIDGFTDLTTRTNMKQRFEASGWMVLECQGHQIEFIEQALQKAQTSDRPVLIDCKTHIGFGAPGKENTPACHGSPLGPEVVREMRKQLQWDSDPFEVPEEILKEWRTIGLRGKAEREKWEKRLETFSDKDPFLEAFNKRLPAFLTKRMDELKERVLHEQKPLATRKASQQVLSVLAESIPFLIGGSADLDAACYTKTSVSVPISAHNYRGNYIHFGIREHAMGAIMNGLSVHGGFVPYGGTFLSFVDYMKPALRLAALMEQQIIYVLTHDSIGVGEDGPTHQPIEQLISLRAIPNVAVFRPADILETIESYEVALSLTKTPSALVLSRQELPLLRTDFSENKTKKGGYVLYEPQDQRDITLIATGSEVSLVMATKDLLDQEGISAAVVSLPCWKLFEEQSMDYQESVLGDAPRLIVEAGSSYGWDRFVGETGAILSIDRFGASAPGKTVMAHFGFTPENVKEVALRLMALDKGEE